MYKRQLVKRFKKRNKTTGTNADRHIGQVGFMLTDLTDIDKTAQAKVCLLYTSALSIHTTTPIIPVVILSGFTMVQANSTHTMSMMPVSYTHLDVYKRQSMNRTETR